MYQEKEKAGAGVYALFFVAFVVIGMALSWLYIGLIDLIPFIYLNLLTTLGFGYAMAFVVTFFKRTYKVTDKITPTVIVFFGLLIVLFMQWQMWFGMWYFRILTDDFYWWFERNELRPLLHIPEFLAAFRDMFRFAFDPINDTNLFAEFINDLRFFNEVGTFSFSDADVTGLVLAVIWIAEVGIICYFPLKAAFIPAGVLLQGKDKLATPKYVTLEFEEFSEYEIDTINSGSPEEVVKIITEKPLADKELHDSASKLAVLCIDNQNTEYISIYKVNINSTNLEDNTLVGKHESKATANIGEEKVNELITKLTELHGELIYITE